MSLRENFTGEGLAHALLLDLTDEELLAHYENKKKPGWISRLIKLFRKKKLYLISFQDGGRRVGYILPAEDAYSACINVVPFLGNDSHSHRGEGQIRFMKDCPECRRVFGQFAAWLNSARVQFIGWANEYTDNVVTRV